MTENIEHYFNDYFHELEGYCLRSERFYETFNNFGNKAELAADMVLWLRAAFEAGWDARDKSKASDFVSMP